MERLNPSSAYLSKGFRKCSWQQRPELSTTTKNHLNQTCYQVSTRSQRPSPTSLWNHSQASWLIGSPTEPRVFKDDLKFQGWSRLNDSCFLHFYTTIFFLIQKSAVVNTFVPALYLKLSEAEQNFYCRPLQSFQS